MPLQIDTEIEELAKLLDVSKDDAMNLALKEGIKEIRLRRAIELYVSGEASIKQAARIADVSLAKWFEIAKERRLPVQIDPDEIESDVEALK